LAFRKQAFKILISKKYTIQTKKEFINRLNSLLEAKFALDTDKNTNNRILKNKYVKEKILFTNFVKKKM
jgi:hypothetical protein